jgi:hypothetical protein
LSEGLVEVRTVGRMIDFGGWLFRAIFFGSTSTRGLSFGIATATKSTNSYWMLSKALAVDE